MYQQSCPFCRTSPANSKRGFISHVARHLQEVSHAAIPPSAMQGDLTEFGNDTEDEALSEGADQADDLVDQPGAAFSKKHAGKCGDNQASGTRRLSPESYHE